MPRTGTVPKKVAAAQAATSARGSRRPTSYDVARLAGVSQSAVSRCFAPGGSIAPATRDRILKVATELGYRPNALAQGLISGRSNMVALLISSQTTLYYPEVLAELTRCLTEHGMRVLLFSLEAESDVDAVLDQVWRHSVDGAISAARLSEDQIHMFADRGVPLVLYNRISANGTADSVGCDSWAGERDLVGRLLGAGHRRFGLIAGPADSFVAEDRRAAALACLAESGITEVPIARGDYSYESGGEGLRTLLAQNAHYDAVLCVNDVMAIGAIDMARDGFGLAVPQDISIVGFDGANAASWTSYRVTSIRQPVRRMTEAAARMLIDRMEDPTMAAEQRLFAGQFIAGRSARIE